ncbi:MAG TPA: sterol desaturase family protein [Vicinamibacterales bacterium]|nr:sterol desaturase family protein [Vicinamibacterales bacterium]
MALRGIVAGLLLLSAGFGLVEGRWPAIRRGWRARRGRATDFVYWFFTPLVTRALTRAAIVVTLVPIFALLGWTLASHTHGFGPLSRQPLLVQALEVIVAGDLIGYWMHRLFHTGRLWPVHAVHHSSRDLDWLSSVRVHPVNDVVMKLAGAVPFVLAGFAPTVLAGYVPFLTLYAILLHANVDWTFGPLRFVIASPVFHRWHHTKEAEAIDKNFSGLLPLWDLMFGTLYLPAGRRPVDFGTREPVPDGFVGQLLYPWRVRRLPDQFPD